MRVLKGGPAPGLACSANPLHLCVSGYVSENVWTQESYYPREALQEQDRLL